MEANSKMSWLLQYDPLNLETLKRKERNTKNQIFTERKEFFRSNKKLFFIIFETLLVKYKK